MPHGVCCELIKIVDATGLNSNEGNSMFTRPAGCFSLRHMILAIYRYIIYIIFANENISKLKGRKFSDDKIYRAVNAKYRYVWEAIAQTTGKV